MNGIFQLRPTRDPRELSKLLHDGDFGGLHGEKGTNDGAEEGNQKENAEQGERRVHGRSP